MSLVSEYNPENKILYLTILDELNASELADAFIKFTHSDVYPPDAGILLDVSSINITISNLKFNLDSIGIQRLIKERGKIRIAIIASDFPLSSMRNMYDALSESKSHNIMAFNNFLEAEQWLEWRDE